MLFLTYSVYANSPGFTTRLLCIPEKQRMTEKAYGSFGFPHRLKIRLNQTLLVPNRDFLLNPDSGLVQLAFQPLASDSLCLEISESPLFKSHRTQFFKPSDIPIYTQEYLSGTPPVDQQNLFNSRSDNMPEYRLNYGGNKSISVNVGNEGGLSLDQSLLLDVDGQVAENVFIKGHLSDQEIPIQPEGNSATLREVDQIYAKIYGTQYSYTLGDYLFQFGENNVDAYLANVQGVQSHYNFKAYRGDVSYSRSRGQFHSYSFEGQFGKQTGYFLQGAGGQEFVTVLAGTEKIWRNGERLIRGRDYQIEYGEGRIDFLNTLIVSGRDRFTVEFQYTDKDYPASLFSLGVKDTLGPFMWDVRGLTQIEDKENPESFILSSRDQSLFEEAGDNDQVRSAGYGDYDIESGWVNGLYYRTGSEKYFVYIPETDFDSLVILETLMFTVYFDVEAGGGYVRDLDSSGAPFYRYDPGSGGGYAPGEIVPMPVQNSHLTVALKYRDVNQFNEGHASSVWVLGSQNDKNLYSPKNDDDNHGYGLLYSGAQSLGQPLDKEGYSKIILKTWIDFKDKNYSPFNQVIEPYQYGELWNLPQRFGVKNYTSQRYQVEDEIFTQLMLGAEYGYLDGSTEYLTQQERGLSERMKGFGRLGKEERVVSSFLESKKASINSRDFDNYKWGGDSKYRLGPVLPSITYTGDEWVSETMNSRKGNSVKHEFNTTIATDALKDKIKLTTAFNSLRWNSNYNGVRDENLDSLNSWDVSQKAELFDLGPWQSDVFVSYQTFQEKEDPSSDFRQNDFRLLEWNNRLQDHRKGYSLYSNYKINQTVDVPLIEVYLPVAPGNGTHVCDTLTSVGGLPVLDCVLDEDKGDMEFLGLRRDSLSRAVGIQELNWSGNSSLTPAKMLKNPYGLLADIRFSLRFQFSNKQDSSSEAGVLPLFSDRQIDEVLEGKSNLQPSIHWQNQKGNQSMQIMFEREYFGSRIGFDRTEILRRQALTWSHDLTESWSYNLRQSVKIKERFSSLAGQSDSSIAYTAGGDFQYRIWQRYKIIPIIDYELSQGVSSTLQGLGEAQQEFEHHSLFPRLRLEREFVTSGRIFMEYGLNNIWGEGDGISRYQQNQKGITHRIQSGIDVQIGQYVFGTGNYLIRKEPDREKLFQNLSLEVRAIF